MPVKHILAPITGTAAAAGVSAASLHIARTFGAHVSAGFVPGPDTLLAIDAMSPPLFGQFYATLMEVRDEMEKNACAAFDIAIAEAKIVFRAFVTNALSLIQPAFALLTCYSLAIIFFGSAYTIFDQVSAAPNFSALGVPSRLTFPEGLYLSVATLTTVGFGDIAPVSPVARLLVSVEILCGVVLLLFGVEAMLKRGNQHHRTDSGQHPNT